MTPQILDGSALAFQINCRFNKNDYLEVIKKCELEKLTQAAFVRIALKQYLQQQKQQTPQLQKTY